MIATLFFRSMWRQSYGLMILTMVVDIDHLLASPVYDALRCSIGFHPLHQHITIVIYFICCFIPRLRFIGIGLLIHMMLDSIDCFVNQGIWSH